MEWVEYADDIFELRLWLAPLLLALFLIPIVRIATAPFEYGGRYFMKLNRRFGQWEHVAMLPRDFLAAPYLALFAIWQAVRAIELSDWEKGAASLIAVALIALCFSQRCFRRRGHLKLVEFASRWPGIHPREFFDHMLCASGALRHVFPERPFQTIDHTNMDFSSASGSWHWWSALMRGVWSTVWIARLILLSAKNFENSALRKTASALALVWAGRAAELSRAQVSVSGRERLQNDAGLDIFLFTHASYLDFALAAVALAARPQVDDTEVPSRCLPTFLVAKDHFRDNPFYYSVLGIGRVAEALGMIFVERSGSRDSAKLIGAKAAEMLSTGDVDLAIFPQGTRAVPCVNHKRERIDSAYYTVGTRARIKDDGKHLKKGAAHIAVQTAQALEERGIKQNVRLLPVALSGTGIACPKGSIKIKAYASMRLNVGEPIIIRPAQTSEISTQYDEFVEQLHSRIDVTLKSAAHVHATLERRFFEDIRSMLEPLELEEISLAMKPWRGDDYLAHAILDAIYACKPDKWRAYLNEFVRLMLDFAPRAELLAFKGRVAESVPT